MSIMPPELKVWREADIRRIVLRRQYLRAWVSRRTDICTLTSLLCRVEEAEERCSALKPAWVQQKSPKRGPHK